VETMSVFLKNLSRANYYLKFIDQNIDKCEKVSIYLKELMKIFDGIIEIFTDLSKVHKTLNLNEESMAVLAEFGHVLP
jgi:predicted metal-dependent hydrolase